MNMDKRATKYPLLAGRERPQLVHSRGSINWMIAETDGYVKVQLAVSSQ